MRTEQHELDRPDYNAGTRSTTSQVCQQNTASLSNHILAWRFVCNAAQLRLEHMSWLGKSCLICSHRACIRNRISRVNNDSGWAIGVGEESNELHAGIGPAKAIPVPKRMYTPHQQQTTPVKSFRALPAAKYRALGYSRDNARDLAY